MAALPEQGAAARDPLSETMESQDRLLIIFVRNLIRGKVKTRLAAHIGPDAAMEVYQQLLQHISQITTGIDAVRELHYSEEVPDQDLWQNVLRKLQKGKDLGERMEEAFRQGFEAGYRKIVLIGSDIPDLRKEDIEAAFSALRENQFVVGPAADGGYYLIGMNSLNSNIFKNKPWGSELLLQETLKDLEPEEICLLKVRHDLDTYEDLKAHKQFRKYITITK